MSTVDSRLPRYHQLRDQIARQIADQCWRPGDTIPSEAELASGHGVAIGTVRKAIDMLVADGLVERVQGRGTFVRRPNFDNAFLRFIRRQGGAGSAAVPESRILVREVVPAPSAAALHLGLEAGAPALHLRRLRLAAGRPVMAEHIWLDHARFAPMLALADDDIGPLLYPAYERHCGQLVASAEETLTVGAADDEDAAALDLAAGVPVVIIERRALGYDGRCLEWRVTHAAATNFRYKIDIR